MFLRHGRMTTSRMVAETMSRSAVVPSGPMRGKIVLASDALHWMELMEMSSRQSEQYGEEAENFMVRRKIRKGSRKKREGSCPFPRMVYMTSRKRC